MAVSLGSAALAYKASAKEGVRTFCTFQAVVRPPQTQLPIPGKEFISFTNTLATNLVTAAAPTVYKEVAKAEKVKPGVIQRQTRLTKAPGVGQTGVLVSDTQAARTIRRANALCAQFVATIKQQRTDQANAQIAAIQSRIVAIQKDLSKLLAIAPARRSPVDKAYIVAHTRGITQNANLIAAIRSGVPDAIHVVTPAETVQKTTSVSLPKNLVIALVAGLLVSFLYILIGESVAERRLLRLGTATAE